MPALSLTGKYVIESAAEETPHLSIVPSEPEEAAVALVALAIDRLGPASLRAISTGRRVEVVVPDADIAAIFRAALARTARRRPTDLLVKISAAPI
jgi:hypothetical protein